MLTFPFELLRGHGCVALLSSIQFFPLLTPFAYPSSLFCNNSLNMSVEVDFGGNTDLLQSNTTEQKNVKTLVLSSATVV